MPSAATAGMGSKIYIGDGGVGAGVKATRTIGTSNQQVLYTAKLAGTAGNSITVAQVNGGASQSLTVGVVGTAITVNLATDGSSVITSTASDVIDAIDASTAASALVDASNGTGNGSGLAVVGTAGALTGGTAGSEVFTAIGEVKGINGPNMSSSVVDVTNFDSANNTREFIASLIDPGEITFDVNFLPANTAQQSLTTDMTSRVKRNFRVVWSDAASTTWSFTGIITGFGVSAGIDDALSASVTIKLTSFPSF